MRYAVLVVLAGLVLASSASAAPFTVGAGFKPSVAVDAAGTAYLAWYGPESGTTSLQFCRVPRGATACDLARTIPAPGTSTQPAPRVGERRGRTDRAVPLQRAPAAGVRLHVGRRRQHLRRRPQRRAGAVRRGRVRPRRHDHRGDERLAERRRGAAAAALRGLGGRELGAAVRDRPSLQRHGRADAGVDAAGDLHRGRRRTPPTSSTPAPATRTTPRPGGRRSRWATPTIRGSRAARRGSSCSPATRTGNMFVRRWNGAGFDAPGDDRAGRRERVGPVRGRRRAPARRLSRASTCRATTCSTRSPTTA